jgi:hypothetical protein
MADSKVSALGVATTPLVGDELLYIVQGGGSKQTTVDDVLDLHINDATAAHAGTAISFAPAGNLAATTVQAALEELDGEKQPLDGDLTAIAALTTTATGRSILTVADSGVDRLPFFDDSASTIKLGVIADFTVEAAPASGDKLFIQRAGTDDLAIIDWDDLPSGGVVAAEDVSFTPAGNIAATDAQAAIEELDTEKLAASAYTAADVLSKLLTVDGSGSGLDADLLDGNSSAFFATATGLSDHITDAADAHDASAISFVAGGNLAATDVQAAIDELDDEKQPLDADLTSWAGVTRASGFDTFAATPTSANLDSLVTDDTGSGALVFANTPTLVSPLLGTPTSGVLTNCTGLPTIVVANEATDISCFLAFFTAASGELGPKTNANATLNSNTGVVTLASSILTTTDINGGTIDGAVIGGASAAAGTFTTLAGTTVELGAGQTDTTLSRVSAGVAAIEGNNILTTVTGQPLDADLTSWAGVTRASGFDTFTATPSSANLRALLTDETGTGVAYFQGGDAGTPSALVLTNATGLTSAGVAAATLVTAADTVVGNDNDTTWPTTAAIIDYAQPLDADLTAIAALTTTATGRSALTFADPGVDRLPFFDDSASTMKLGVITDFTVEASPASGDKLFIQRAGTDDLAIIDWDDLPGAGGGINNVSEDTSPTLGGNLDGAGFSVGVVGSQISDIFLEEGGVINWDAGDFTITQTGNAVVLTGGTVSVGDSHTTGRATRALNILDAAGVMRVWRVTSDTGLAPSVDLVWGNTGDDAFDAANMFWDIALDAADEAFNIRRRTGGPTEIFVSVHSDGLVEIPGSQVIGHDTLEAFGVNTPNVQIHATDAAASMGMFRWSNDANPPRIMFNKSRGTTIGDLTVVQNGDKLGEFLFYGSEGAGGQTHSGALFGARVGAVPGDDDMPGELYFGTTANADTIPTERLLIKESGRLVALTTGQVAHFWVYWTGASTTILASHNVTSIDNDATGDAGINLTVGFSSNNYAAFVTTNETGADGWDADSIQSCGINVHTASVVDVLCGVMVDGGTAAGNLTNPDQWNACGFGVSA